MKSILALLTIMATFIAPIKTLILMLIAFIVADTILGIYCTIKLHGIKSFRSGKLFNIVVKSFFYVLSVIMALMLDKFIFDGSIFGIKLLLCKAMAIFWTYIEVKSLDETSIKLGNKSFWEIAKEMVRKAMTIKKDIKKIIE
jgi:hypothetical protein